MQAGQFVTYCYHRKVLWLLQGWSLWWKRHEELQIAGFYFLLRFLPFLYYGLRLQYTFLTLWNYCVLIFLLSTILIALVQPYKSTYMNVLDTLMLGLTVYGCAGLSQTSTYFEDIVIQLTIMFFFPSIAFGLILLLRILIKLYKRCSSMVKAKLQSYSTSELDDQLKPLLGDQWLITFTILTQLNHFDFFALIFKMYHSTCQPILVVYWSIAWLSDNRVTNC